MRKVLPSRYMSLGDNQNRELGEDYSRSDASRPYPVSMHLPRFVVLVPEVSSSGKHHGNIVSVGSIYGFLISYGATWLNYGCNATLRS